MLLLVAACTVATVRGCRMGTAIVIVVGWSRTL